MNLDDVAKYFTITRLENGLFRVMANGLDGASFLARNKENLKELTLDNRRFDRVLEMESFCLYRERKEGHDRYSQKNY